MTVVLIYRFLLFLFCGSAVGTRAVLFPIKLQPAAAALFAAAATDGICETMVKTRGYACEEHKVICLETFILL